MPHDGSSKIVVAFFFDISILTFLKYYLSFLTPVKKFNHMFHYSKVEYNVITLHMFPVIYADVTLEFSNSMSPALPTISNNMEAIR